jgi:hypothetical protein
MSDHPETKHSRIRYIDSVSEPGYYENEFHVLSVNKVLDPIRRLSTPYCGSGDRTDFYGSNL